MTQEVQPLDYVKRTNIEEHKQFHDKINEIVENLAPTVDRADQLLQQVGEQSTQVANAVTTANTASTQAQAAAATALGIGDRVTAVENSAAQNHSDITVLDGEVADINNDLTNVVRKVTNDVQKVNKGLRVGEVPIGDDVVISRKVLQDFVDAYEAMVRTTGAFKVAGPIDFLIPAFSKPNSVVAGAGWRRLYEETNTVSVTHVSIIDVIADGEEYARIFVKFKANSRPVGQILIKSTGWNTSVKLSRDASNNFTVWINDSRHFSSIMMSKISNNNTVVSPLNVPEDYTVIYAEPVEPDYPNVTVIR